MSRLASLACAAVMGIGIVATAVAAASAMPPAEDEVRALFARFTDIQNAHDIDATDGIWLASPDAQLVYNGTTTTGHDAVVAKFRDFYSGTWAMLPDNTQLDIRVMNDNTAVMTAPVELKVGPAPKDFIERHMMIREMAVRTPDGWRILSIAQAGALR